MGIEQLRQWWIGDVEVTRIVEISTRHNALDFLLEGGTPEMILGHDWLFPDFALPDGDMKIWFQCFLVRSQGLSILVDTCIGNGRDREHDVFAGLTSDFLESLASVGATPESIDVVLCTHLHDDHVGWNTRMVDGEWVPTFPNARYLFVRAEAEHWDKVRAGGHTRHLEHFVDAVDPVVAAGLVELVAPDHDITSEIRLTPTHGHTPGHVSVVITSNGEEAVITGDLMHHPVQIVYPEFHVRFDSDPVQGALTRAAFVDRYANTPTQIIGTHFCDPTVGYITGQPGSRRFSPPT